MIEEYITDALGVGALDQQVWNDIVRFEQTAMPIIDRIWCVEAMQDHELWPIIHSYYRRSDELKARFEEQLKQATEALYQQLGSHLGSIAATFWLHPHLWKPLRQARISTIAENHESAKLTILETLAERCVEQWPPYDLSQRLLERLGFLCKHQKDQSSVNRWLVLRWLIEREDSRSEPFISAVAEGDWNKVHTLLCSLSRRPELNRGIVTDVLTQLVNSNWTIHFLRRFYERDSLSAERFEHMVNTFSSTLSQVSTYLGNYRTPDDAFKQTLQTLYAPVAWRMLQDFHPDHWDQLRSLSFFAGGQYLLSVAEQIEVLGLPHLQGHYHSPSYILQRVLNVLERHPSDDSVHLTELLKRFQPATLIMLLPHADDYRPELLAALGAAWQPTLKLIETIEQLDQNVYHSSDDPYRGIVDYQALEHLLKQFDTTIRDTLLNVFKPYSSSGVSYLEAILGINRTTMKQRFSKRNQLAAKIIGLLPFTDKDGVVERYQALIQFEKDANKSSAGRKNAERLAAQIGLANLASHAGYPDATRLEWAMQRHLGSEQLQIGRTWEIDRYTITLSLRNHEPALEVHNGKRVLKRTPSIVRRSYEYREMSTTLEKAKLQYRRYRDAFLNCMRSASPINLEEQALLRESPLAVSLLERLVLRDQAGAYGLYRGEDHSLEGVLQERVPINGCLTIVHPIELQANDLLRDWQRSIVERQLVQPFKQLFREQYLLTPAEETSLYSSARLAGRQIKGDQALAVLASMGWSVSYNTAEKSFYQHGFMARFAFEYSSHIDAKVSGNVEFWPLKRTYNGKEERIPLTEIPALIFSEVLRDLDVVTVIAHQNEWNENSREVQTQRAEVAKLVFDSLGVQAVNVEAPFIHVTGQRARYRINLTTGAIHLDSGQYLCIVPSRKEQQAVYLPFEQQGDSILSEIISKALLLCNDHTITDQTILAQLSV